jgi:hypothetical protein
VLLLVGIGIVITSQPRGGEAAIPAE